MRQNRNPLRFSNIHSVAKYQKIKVFEKSPIVRKNRKWNVKKRMHVTLKNE